MTPRLLRCSGDTRQAGRPPLSAATTGPLNSPKLMPDTLMTEAGLEGRDLRCRRGAIIRPQFPTSSSRHHPCRQTLISKDAPSDASQPNTWRLARSQNPPASRKRRRVCSRRCAKHSGGTMARCGTSTPAPPSCAASKPGTYRPCPWPEFEAASRRIVFTRGVGLPGRVWAAVSPRGFLTWWTMPTSRVRTSRGRKVCTGAFALADSRPASGSSASWNSSVVRSASPTNGLLRMLTQVGAHIGQFMERKRAEEDLERVLHVVARPPVSGRIRRVFQAGESRVGAGPRYTTEELLARPYLDFVHPDDRNPTTTEADKLGVGGQRAHVRKPLHRERRHIPVAAVERGVAAGRSDDLCRGARRHRAEAGEGDDRALLARPQSLARGRKPRTRPASRSWSASWRCATC